MKKVKQLRIGRPQKFKGAITLGMDREVNPLEIGRQWHDFVLYLTIKELAYLLHVSDRTIYSWRKNGKLKEVHYKNRILFESYGLVKLKGLNS